MTQVQLAALVAALNAAGIKIDTKPRKNYGKVAARKPYVQPNPTPANVTSKQDRQLKRHAAVVKGFNAKGFKSADVKLYENVKTYKGWLADGRIVSKGQHGVRGLFHVSQTQLNSPALLPDIGRHVAVTVLAPETREHFDAKMVDAKQLVTA